MGGAFDASDAHFTRPGFRALERFRRMLAADWRKAVAIEATYR